VITEIHFNAGSYQSNHPEKFYLQGYKSLDKSIRCRGFETKKSYPNNCTQAIFHELPQILQPVIDLFVQDLVVQDY
jgi:hypothetical protein